MNHHILLIVHLLCAAIWVGGHMYLCIGLLPGIIKNKDNRKLIQFEKSFEAFGMTALLLMVITGIWMAAQFGVGLSEWFSFSSPIERVVSTKLILLLSTILLALSAQIRLIPLLKSSPIKLNEMALHIIAITMVGIVMLILGSFVRYGGI
jgi:putative copper export protein